MRRILCVPCGHDYKVHPLDAAEGFKMRKVTGLARRPMDHALMIGGVKMATVTLVCDQCGKELADGAPCVGITYWNASRVSEPAAWECDYMLPAGVAPELKPLVDAANAFAAGVGASPFPQ